MNFDELTNKLEELTDLIFDNEESFMRYCIKLNDSYEIISVTFGSEYVSVTLVFECGQHCNVSVDNEKFQEWAESLLVVDDYFQGSL